jgi:hypothetical protein
LQKRNKKYEQGCDKKKPKIGVEQTKGNLRSYLYLYPLGHPSTHLWLMTRLKVNWINN